MQQFIRIAAHILNTDIIGSVEENHQREQHEGGGTCTRIWLRWGNSLPIGTLHGQPPQYLDVTGREAQAVAKFFQGLEQSGGLANPLRPATASETGTQARIGTNQEPAAPVHKAVNRGGRPKGARTVAKKTAAARKTAARTMTAGATSGS